MFGLSNPLATFPCLFIGLLLSPVIVGCHKPHEQTPAEPEGSVAAPSLDESPVFAGQSLSAWIAQTKSSSAEERIKAAEQLGQFCGREKEPPKNALVALIEMLRDRDHATAFVARTAIERCSPKTESLLLVALHDANANFRREVAQTLQDTSQELSYRKEPLLSEVSTAFLTDPDAEVRQSLSFALARIGKPALPTLVKGLQSGDRDTRRLSILALDRMGPKAANTVPSLMAQLPADDDELRIATVNALGRIGNDTGEVLPALLTIARGTDPAARQARELVGKVWSAPRSSAAALRPFLADQDPFIRLKAVEVLCEMEEDDKDCLETLLDLVKRRNSEVRQKAATLLAKYGSAAKPAVAALSEVVRNDPNPSTRTAAIIALGAIGPDAKEVAPLLKSLLADEQSNSAKSHFQQQPLGPSISYALKKIEH